MSKVCQLFSGSSGNCIYISSKGHSFLVDIGVTAKRTEYALRDIGVDPASIEAVFVTHEHGDHANGVRVFAGRHGIPVFSSGLCIDSMYAAGLLDGKNECIELKGETELDGISIVPFRQSHDSADCLGYRFNLSDNRSVSVCTDTGFITDAARQALLGTELIFLESNHEISMVENGFYPYPLKKRILGAKGHLSNFACGEFIKELAESGTTRFVLAHLSRENNTPDIARQTAVAALDEIGLSEGGDYRLYVSPPENNGGCISL
jgi:phosphoribosyl 1,2-cyclic phosphodiesterase